MDTPPPAKLILLPAKQPVQQTPQGLRGFITVHLVFTGLHQVKIFLWVTQSPNSKPLLVFLLGLLWQIPWVQK